MNARIRLAQALRHAQHLLIAYPRRIAAAVLAVMAGLSASAFGIASVAPDAALLPRSTVVETIPLPDMDAQLEALAGHTLQLSRADSTRAGDTADTLLRRLGAADPKAAAFLRADPVARRLVEGRPGKRLRAMVAEDGRLIELVARFPLETNPKPAVEFHRLSVLAQGEGFVSRLETAPLQTRVRMAGGTIRSSLFAATDEAGLPDMVAAQVAEVFSAEIDFHRELRRGDTFSVVYEALFADDELVTWNEGVGRVLAIDFVNGGRAYQALWFETPDGRGAYFDARGRSLKRAYLASPLEFSRMTSGFAMRFHPLLQRWRAHLGVDYAAPTGTPVRSVGDGRVVFAGRQGGYGNVVHVEHANDHVTVYAHLSRIDVRQGQRVEQGQRVGAVGATGWATGPHLHFEFRVDGVHRDPLTLARQSETMTLDAALVPRFQSHAAVLQAKLEAGHSIAGGGRGVE